MDSLGDRADEWPDEEMYLYINNGAFCSSPDETTAWPNYLRVDHIRIYQRE